MCQASCNPPKGLLCTQCRLVVTPCHFVEEIGISTYNIAELPIRAFKPTEVLLNDPTGSGVEEIFWNERVCK